MKLSKLERAAIGITVLTLVVMGSYFWGTQRGAEPVTITAQQAAPPVVSAPAETAAPQPSQSSVVGPGVVSQPSESSSGGPGSAPAEAPAPVTDGPGEQ